MLALRAIRSPLERAFFTLSRVKGLPHPINHRVQKTPNRQPEQKYKDIQQKHSAIVSQPNRKRPDATERFPCIHNGVYGGQGPTAAHAAVP